MKPSFEILKEYSKTDFILYSEYAVTESINNSKTLFRGVKISHDGSGKVLEEKPFTLIESDLDFEKPHKIKSCILFNNEEHKRAWKLFLDINRSNYNNITESGINMIQYLDNVMLLYEMWFNKNDIINELEIQRMLYNRSFRSIRKGKTEYSFTEQQSLVIKYLYELAIQGIPWTTSSEIVSHIDELQGIYTSNKRLLDIFKNNKEAYHTLLIKDSGKIKLNID
tara:strand:+ start:285 stop:956 length:672 start_codon:yes stop_codon:yes gene_type:complete